MNKINNKLKSIQDFISQSKKWKLRYGHLNEYEVNIMFQMDDELRHDFRAYIRKDGDNLKNRIKLVMKDSKHGEHLQEQYQRTRQQLAELYEQQNALMKRLRDETAKYQDEIAKVMNGEQSEFILHCQFEHMNGSTKTEMLMKYTDYIRSKATAKKTVQELYREISPTDYFNNIWLPSVKDEYWADPRKWINKYFYPSKE